MSAANAVAKQNAPTDKPTTLTKKLEESFAVALPTHVTKEQFARALLTAFRRNPKLVDCTPLSVSSSVMTAAQLGLMIGVNGACWLVPFKDECTLIIGYQGMVDLCYRSGKVESLFSDVVCENDAFSFVQGLNQRLDHTPCMDGPRGKPYAVYALASIKESSRPVFVFMNRDEVMQVKKASPAARKPDSPWNGPFETEMWKKTAIRRLAKVLPKSVELSEALDFESRQEERWAEAAVVDDPFAQGRKSLPSRSDANAGSGGAAQPAAAAPEPSSEFQQAYSKLNLLYNEHGKDIDAMLFKHGTGRDLPEMQNTTDAKEIVAIIKTATAFIPGKDN